MYKKVKWIVVRWKSLGNKIWFPTANIEYKKWIIKDWTYKINIIYNDNVYGWAWMYKEEIELFEAHIFNFDKNIYWEEIEVIIHEKIRDNKKFDSIDELKNQITKDIEYIKNIEDYVLTFWTFDVVHPWHEYFLKQSKSYWDKLITIVSTDENVKLFKWSFPLNNEKERFNDVKSLKISDIVCIWKWDNPLLWLNLYNPKVICLWYDQIWFYEDLENYMKEKNLDIKIIRIPPYKENIYKSSIIKRLKI